MIDVDESLDKAAPEQPDLRELLTVSARFAKPFSSRMAVIGIFSLSLAVLGALEPYVLKLFFDALTEGKVEPRSIVYFFSILITLEVVRALLKGWTGVATLDVRLKLDLWIREIIIDKLNRSTVAYHHENGPGALRAKMDLGVNGFVGATMELAFNLIPAFVYFVVALITVVKLNLPLTFVVLFFTPLPALIGAWASREQVARERKLTKFWTQLFSRFVEVMSGFSTVKGYGMEDVEGSRFINGLRSANAVVSAGSRTDAKTSALRDVASTLARLIVIGLGGYYVLRGEITVGTLIAFLGYISGFFGPVQSITGVYQTARKATVSYALIKEILEHEQVLLDKESAVDAPRFKGDVEFRNVSFGYSEESGLVLSDFSLRVNAGETIAFVGPSGTGKTTLMNLLQRLYVPVSGDILVDGTDISDFKQISYRQQIGVVYQDVHLFNDSILENIRYGRPDATVEDVEVAARIANAHDFICAMTDGYDTMIGERGGRLSGGQRQRIAIARAILKDPPILILDEATSALDTESESLVQAAIGVLSRDRTTFMIAHRLSTVMNADKIVVLKHGRIIEQGTHSQLMKAGGYYSSVVSNNPKEILANYESEETFSF